MSSLRERVLIVDDDPLMLELLRHQLQALGVEHVLTTESGDAALEALRGDPAISMVLTDISMPGMDGPRLLRHLADAHCAAKIVLVSGVSVELLQSIGELGRSHGLQIVGYIHKPVLPEALEAMLHAQSPRPMPRAKPAEVQAAPPDVTPERLRRAIDEREIHPWYQPKVDSQGLSLAGVEALARWRLPDGSLVSPAAFIPAIEANDLSHALFFGMLEQVLADLRLWRDRGRKVKASINLSMACTQDLDLPEAIGRRVAAAGVPLEQLVIEVTESGLMTNRAASMETLTRMSLMGLTLSIDDFGTGYSSLAQLSDLPFGELKIDGGFVQRAGRDKKADAILRTTVTFGHSLGMDVVAEGVEHFAQLEALRQLGARLIQGYLIARPMPAVGFNRWLDAWRPGSIGRPGCNRPLSVLVVDDSPSARVVVEAELQERLPEARFVSAANADEAETLLARDPVDCAVLDFHMPGINGLELLKRLREKAPAARFVLLTADVSDAIAAQATALGAMYCPKPLTGPQAERIVRHFTRD